MTSAVSSELTSLVNYISRFDGTHRIAFDHTTITVNISGLTVPQMYDSARLALAAWSSVTGLKFKLSTSSKADIVIDDTDSSGAYGGPVWELGTYSIIRSTVNVPRNWMNYETDTGARWGVGSYGLYTFIHEIGHALGLYHSGPYDGWGSYADDAIFKVDTLQYTVMSYFAQSNYEANGASDLNPMTPMIADIEAIKLLYGALPVNAGDTRYGKGETAYLGITDLSKYPAPAYTIRDTGGIDTLDISNATRASTIDLRPGHFSDINGKVGNVTIARGTVIENASATKFSDTVIGNSAANTLKGNGGDDRIEAGSGNDRLYGGTGNDKLYGGSGNDLLYGESGKDVLYGGAGNDKLYGGSGIDRMYGGTGKDTFCFKAYAESGATKASADIILDFSIAEGDRIDLSALDANVKAAGDQAFIYRGTSAFSGKYGELRYEKLSSDTYIYCDNDGDRTAEFVLRLDDPLKLTAACFIL